MCVRAHLQTDVQRNRWSPAGNCFKLTRHGVHVREFLNAFLR